MSRMENMGYFIPLKNLIQKKIFYSDLVMPLSMLPQRNRCYISDDKGLRMLTVPIRKSKGNLAPEQMEISYHTSWQHIHWSAICSSYGKTPFFSEFEYSIKKIFEKKYSLLMELNREIFEFMLDAYRISQDDFLNLSGKIKIPMVYCNHFGIHIVRMEELSLLEFLFRFGPAGIYDFIEYK